jgi:hypothetical protein
MLTYEAMYKYLDENVHAEVLDFQASSPVVRIWKRPRRLLASALADHSIWENPAVKRRTSVPRHREIPDFTASRICTQL